MRAIIYAGHVGAGASRLLIHSVLRDGVAIAEIRDGAREVGVAPLRRLTPVEDAVIRRFVEDVVLGKYRGVRGEVRIDEGVYVTIGEDR